MIATDDIQAGGEIFVSYGEHWFLSREDEYGSIPFENNFDVVDKFLKKFKVRFTLILE